MKTPYTVLVIPDVHVPYHDVRSLTALEGYMKDTRFDEVIYIGDFLDFAQISRFNKGSPKEESRTLSEDYKIAGKILDRHISIIRANNKKAKFTLLEGNHEERIERWVAQYPQVEHMIEVPVGLKLGERGINWIRSFSKGELYKVGKAYFTHGLYTNQYHAQKMVNNFGVNIYYGHTHDHQSFSKIFKGKDKVVEGMSLGCMCELEQSYMHGRPHNWQQGFGVFQFDKDTGYFNRTFIGIFNHSFISPTGKLYSG